MADRVLVTGGTGFLGGWCIAKLLERGYEVRTTVRSLSRADQLRDAVAKAGAEAGERLEIVTADLTADEGWAEAVADCRYVLHTASPFPPEQPKDPDELIVPARDGALRVLKASLAAGAERVVMTSSIASTRPARDSTESSPYTEADWTDGNDTSKTPYTRSKAIAERAAWDLVEKSGDEKRLATIEPGAIIGPVLHDDYSFSIQAIERLLTGDMPAIPKLGFSFVDVRDVAEMHILAMTTPEAGGQRFIATDEFLWLEQVADVLRERLGDQASKVPSRKAPDFLIRLMSIFDKSIRSISGDLGQRSWFSSAKARETLGWKPIPVGDSIEQTARSLL
jgi:dihydroflavonol-4-reductase